MSGKEVVWVWMLVNLGQAEEKVTEEAKRRGEERWQRMCFMNFFFFPPSTFLLLMVLEGGMNERNLTYDNDIDALRCVALRCFEKGMYDDSQSIPPPYTSSRTYTPTLPYHFVAIPRKQLICMYVCMYV